jgi:hypothetical protein
MSPLDYEDSRIVTARSD